ncbi:extracellular catalytic domain type 1 short-chain-length polyhydroxyalkanoate depolymerase [Luedemannella helvata]|uniref:Beta-xylanase n=1 Tax=Luedemannella helvata TaxID=349315 RepID=A0ABN2JQH6_9ACTN
MRLGRLPATSTHRRRRLRTALFASAALAASVLVPLAVTSASAATVVTDFHHDFESGQTHGWAGNGVTAENVVAGADAHGGTGVLSVHDKTGWGVAVRDLTPFVRPGVEYTLTAWVRAAAGSGAVTMTVNAGSDYQNSGSYEVPFDATGWTRISRTYTAAAGQALPSPLQVYFEQSDPLVPYYVDDVTLTHVDSGDPSGTQTVFAHDYEDGSAQGWGPRGSVTVATSTEQAHAGTRSLKTTGRTANWHGPAINLLDKVAAGTQYTFTAYVRMVAGSDTIGATVQKTVDGTQSWDGASDRVTATDTGWTKLTGTWTAPANATELTLYVEGAAATSEYYLDDVSLTYEGEPTDPPLPAGLERVDSFGPNPGNLNMYVHVPATLQAKAPIVVAAHYCTGTASAFYTGSGFGVKEIVQASDRLGFIMIFPEATRDGRCFDSASPQSLRRDGGSDPVSVKSMVDYVQANYTTDPQRVFVMGASSGAMLTQVLLGNYPDVFAAGVSFMGVPHSCFATGSSSNLWNSDCAQGTVAKTGEQWGDLVRAAYPGYTGARPRVQLWHGTEDDIISYNNLAEGVKEWTNLHGVSDQPAASRTLEGTWTRKRYGGTGATPPVEAITVTGNGHDLPRPEMHAYALAFFGLDAPVIEPDPDPEGGPQTLLNHGFENGTTQGWTPRGGPEVVANSTAVAHTGTHSLSVTGRTQSWNAPVVSLLGRLRPGVSYQVEAWVRTSSAHPTATARITMERRLGGTPTYEGISGGTPVTSDGWTKLSGRYILADDVDFLTLYVETDGIEDFFIDDVKITFLPTLPIQTDIASLKDEFARYWPLTGAAVEVPQLLGDHATLLAKHFNSVTPGNAMKWDTVQAQPGVWNFARADRIIALAEAKDMKVYGHVLAWHSQLPAWVFQDGAGNPLPVNAESKQLVLDRLADHIRALVGRYKGKVYAWDAVNEVISDAADETYRQSDYYKYTGLDFIRTAFRVAHETDPDAKLCINDYNTQLPDKAAKYLALVKQLLAEGVPVDCVGHQMHLLVNDSPAQIDKVLGQFQALGLRQRITELDISVYADRYDSYDPIPDSAIAAQRAQYKAVFAAFLKHAAGIDSLTFWGLADDDTWLTSFPINHLDTPLLFDDRLQAKPVFHDVVDLAGNWLPAGPRTATLSADQVVLPTKGAGSLTVTLSASWCPATGSKVVAVGARGTLSAPLSKTRSGTYAAKLPLGGKTPAGRYDVYLSGTDCVGTTYAPPAASARLATFTVLNPTTVSLDVVAEPARKGRELAGLGVLQRLSDGKLTGFSGAQLVVEFKADGATSYTPVTTATTIFGGIYAFQATAKVSGTWRVRYAGDATHAPSDATDHVAVR